MDRSRRRPGVLLSPTPARLTLSPPPLHGVALRFPEPWLSHIAPHIHVHEEEASAPGESCRPITTAALAHAPWDTLLDTHAGRISEHVLSKSPFYSKQSCPAAAAFFSFFLFLNFWLYHVQSLSQEDPLGKGMAIQSSILSCRIVQTEEPGVLRSLGSRRVGHD